MACNTCNGGGNMNLKGSSEAISLPVSLLKPSDVSEDMRKKADQFNKLSIPEPVKEKIVDGVNVVPPVLVPQDSNIVNKSKIDRNDFPSLKEMAFGLTKELKANLENVVSHGILLASPEEMEKRLGICLGCEFFHVEYSRCLKCGCFMNMKTRLQASKCPVDKW